MINNPNVYDKRQATSQSNSILIIKKEWFRKISCIVLIVFTVYATDTAYFTANISTKAVVLVIGFIASLISYTWLNLNTANLSFPKYKLMFLFFLTDMIIATMIYNSDNLRSYLHIFLLIFCGFFISELISFRVFARVFKTCMFFLCTASLISFILQPFILQYYYLFPQFNNASGVNFVNLWVSTVPFIEVNRNYGVFWEPGVFQAYINLALIFELFFNENPLRASYLLVFILTVFTTLSTAGLICLGLIILAYGIKTKFMTTNSIKVLLFIVLLFSGMLVYVQSKPDVYYAEGVNSVFGKLSDKGGSYDERLNSTIASLYVSINNPFLGVGINNNLEIARQMGSSINKEFKSHTNTIAYWLASYGLILGLTLCFLYMKLCFVICRVKVIRLYVLLIMGVVIIMLANENFLNSLFFNTLIFYSLTADNKGLLQR